MTVPHRAGVPRAVWGGLVLLFASVVIFYNVTRISSLQQVDLSTRSQIERNAIRDAARDYARDRMRDSERDRERDGIKDREQIALSNRRKARLDRNREPEIDVRPPESGGGDDDDNNNAENKQIQLLLQQGSGVSQPRFNYSAFAHLVKYKPIHPTLTLLRPPNNYFLVVMIMSHLANRGMRDSQRETWMQYPIMYHHKLRPNAPIRAFFVIGQQHPAGVAQLKAENDLYGDVVMVDSDDGPHAQKFIAFIHYLEKQGIHYDYFAKVDTDTFLRPLLLANDILNLPKERQKRLYLGYGWVTNFTICDKVDHKVFFHTGSTVILSRDILDWVSNHSGREIEHCDYTEDVRTGYWVQEFATQTNQIANVMQSKTYCHSPIDRLSDPNIVHQRCVSYHLGLTKHNHKELFNFMYHHWPADGREPVPDFFPWIELEKAIMLYRNEFWKKMEREQSRSHDSEMWHPKPEPNAKPEIYFFVESEA